jgi:hypothetical protein
VRAFIENLRVQGDEAMIGLSIHCAVLVRKILIRGVVIGFVDHQAARIRVVASKHTAGCREKRLRKLRAGTAVVDDRGIDTS